MLQALRNLQLHVAVMTTGSFIRSDVHENAYYRFSITGKLCRAFCTYRYSISGLCPAGLWVVEAPEQVFIISGFTNVVDFLEM